MKLGFSSLPLISSIDPKRVTPTGRCFVGHTPLLAIDPKASSQVWDFEKEPELEPQIIDDLAIVTIRGPLSSEPNWWFETYDGILRKVACAFDTEAKTIVIKGCSPGGDVANCFTTSRTLRELADSHPDKEFIWYVDGQTCSAALALAMACDRIILPEEARFGSIGVIAELQNFLKQATAQGVEVALITSGEAKADGHPLAELTDEMRARIQASVDYESNLFYQWVSERTSLSVEKIKGFKAGIFHGQEAVEVGLADEVSSFSRALTMLVGQPSINSEKEVDMPGMINRGSAAEADGFESIRGKLAKMAGEDSDEGRKARKLLDTMDEKEPEEGDKKEEHQEPDGDEGEDEGDTDATAAEDTDDARKAEDDSDDARKAESEETDAKADDESARKAEDEAEEEDTKGRKALRSGKSSEAIEHLNKATKLRNKAKSHKASARHHRSMARVFQSNAALAAKLTAVEARVGKRIPTTLPVNPAVAALSAKGARGDTQGHKPSAIAQLPAEVLKAAGIGTGAPTTSFSRTDGARVIAFPSSPADARARLAQMESELKGQVS